MPTVKVFRYDADTGKAISTFVRVGKLQASYTIDENGKSVLDEKAATGTV